MMNTLIYGNTFLWETFLLLLQAVFITHLSKKHIFNPVSSLSPWNISQSALHLSFLLLTRLSLYLCAFPSYRLFNLLSLSLPLTACGCASPFCLSVILIWKQQVQVFSHKVPLTLERAIGERGAINDRGPIEPINDLIQGWYLHFRYITSCISFSGLSHVWGLQLWMSFTEIELRWWRWKIKIENIRFWGMEETVRPYHCNK